MPKSIPIILITGATRGLGFDLAIYFYNKGYRLVLVGRSLDRIKKFFKEKSQDNVLFFDMDFDSITDSSLNLLQNELNDFGYPEYAIYCAGGGLRLSMINLKYGDAIKLLNANLLGAIAINSILIPEMSKFKKGRLIFIGSMAATHAIGSVGYNMVKSALNAYVRSIGNALIKDSILACGINPGDFLATDNSMSRLKSDNPDLYNKFVLNRSPRGGMGESFEIIEVINYLAFEANSLFAGSMVALDGGGSLSY